MNGFWTTINASCIQTVDTGLLMWPLNSREHGLDLTTFSSPTWS